MYVTFIQCSIAKSRLALLETVISQGEEEKQTHIRLDQVVKITLEFSLELCLLELEGVLGKS